MVSAVGLTLLSVVVFVSTGSIMSVMVVITLAVIMFFVLQKLGILDIKYSNKRGFDISLFEKIPAPAPSKPIMPTKNIEQPEVFYISGNDYTYDDAAAVCAAFDSELATYDQVTTAYTTGAEWCGYGWSQGGMALFPTQDSTWQALQMEVNASNRTACGRPGVNGGYFDPATKFGVNCYGVKPSNHGTKFPLPIPGTDTNGFNNLVNKFKSMIKRIQVSPFNRDGWSEWSMKTHEPT